MPLQVRGIPLGMHTPLIFQNTAGLGTIHKVGCRGFTGPVPPPLWIRVPQGLISPFYTTRDLDWQEQQT